jgi:hypothetical protein
VNQKQGKGTPNTQNKGPSQDKAAQENPPNLQEKNNTMKPKKDMRKWCEFHKSFTHKTSECRAKKSLVVELKASESDSCSDSELEPNKGNDRGEKIIDMEPISIVATTKIQKEEPEDPEEAKCLFHSKMWVNGSPLQFIGWLHQGRDLHVSQQCRLPYNIKPFTNEVLCDISCLNVYDVLLGQPYLWKKHVLYESMPRVAIITLGNNMYRIQDIESPVTISLVTTNQCNKLISKTRKFFFLLIFPQGKNNIVAMTSRQVPSA